MNKKYYGFYHTFYDTYVVWDLLSGRVLPSLAQYIYNIYTCRVSCTDHYEACFAPPINTVMIFFCCCICDRICENRPNRQTTTLIQKNHCVRDTLPFPRSCHICSLSSQTHTIRKIDQYVVCQCQEHEKINNQIWTAKNMVLLLYLQEKHHHQNLMIRYNRITVAYLLVAPIPRWTRKSQPPLKISPIINRLAKYFEKRGTCVSTVRNGGI